MNKTIFLLLLFPFLLTNIYAQDTSAYEIQRAKINALLAERSAKFGQYDESLNARTGIFGFQTKRDIKNSNEILRQIAINDNEIFTQLKVLMDYKDLQAEQIKTAANSNSESIQNYRKTIKDLQEQNQILADNQDKKDNAKDLAYLLMFIFLIGCAVLGYFLNLKNKQIKQYEKTAV
ncbi:hypothetical protein FA048_09025 [Pedobacter polaris]|uniref:tRNA (Guanine-N1)-methyltransferase n=1 Tax=Pedobacter polaris TaxID=2571273 RepID=A0A4U1CT22_9SPHI|nr:hypothetical protein FA048_09025 [Pedobacter polaris]